MRADVVIVGGSVVGSSAPGICARTASPAASSSSSAIRATRGRRRFWRWAASASSSARRSPCRWCSTASRSGRSSTERFATTGHKPRAWFRQRGYLFLADANAAAPLMQRYEPERRAGAHVQLLSRDDVRALVPDLFLDDVVFGVLGPEDGYAAPREVLLRIPTCRGGAAASNTSRTTSLASRRESAQSPACVSLRRQHDLRARSSSTPPDRGRVASRRWRA